MASTVPKKLPKLIAFDLDGLLWNPEMYELVRMVALWPFALLFPDTLSNLLVPLLNDFDLSVGQWRFSFSIRSQHSGLLRPLWDTSTINWTFTSGFTVSVKD